MGGWMGGKTIPMGILTERFLGQMTNQTTFVLKPAFTTKTLHGQEG
jgi:hypothetical protein